jgi:hypothetical protein
VAEVAATIRIDYGPEMTRLLTEIRDRLPLAPGPDNVTSRKLLHANDPAVALYKLLRVLDGWIEGAHGNHDATGHRGEVQGEECWRSFTPADIRNMVNDAARELGLPEFSLPKVAREDMK